MKSVIACRLSLGVNLKAVSTPEEPQMFTHMHIAKPVTNIERSFVMYSQCLYLHKIAEFNDHDGFNRIM